MIVFILFPSLGVWAMGTRLQYYIQPLDKIWSAEATEADRSPKGTASQGVRTPDSKPSLTHSRSSTVSVAYQRAEDLREKMQSKLNQILNSEH